MITLQHSLITLISDKDGDMKKFESEVPYVLLPDAIRRYLGPRQYSHFEMSEDKKDTSWLKYPSKIKDLSSKEDCEGAEKHIVENIRKCCLGEETNIDSFEEHNKHLDPDYYYGVKKHLTQDYIFDKYVREWIDCSQMYDGKFKFNATGEELDDKGVRGKIAEIEQHGLYVLAFLAHETSRVTGKEPIIANQAWFDEHVKKPLDGAYSQDLADGTYNYMKIPDNINEWITNCDWSHLSEGPIPMDEYKKMYLEVAKAMAEIDMEKEENKLKTVEEPDEVEV